MSGVTYLAPHVGVLAACVTLAVARASYYRSLAPRVATPRPAPPRTLSAGERANVLAVLHEPRFVDLAYRLHGPRPSERERRRACSWA